jgi:hypothetical protein
MKHSVKLMIIVPYFFVSVKRKWEKERKEVMVFAAKKRAGQ